MNEWLFVFEANNLGVLNFNMVSHCYLVLVTERSNGRKQCVLRYKTIEFCTNRMILSYFETKS